MRKEQVVKKARAYTVSVARAIFLIAFSFVLLYPVFFMISNAFMTRADVINPVVEWIPRAPSFYSFEVAFKAMAYPTSLGNTLVFQIVSAVISVFSLTSIGCVDTSRIYHLISSRSFSLKEGAAAAMNTPPSLSLFSLTPISIIS